MIREKKVKEYKDTVFLGVHMDKQIFERLDSKVKTLGITKEKYLREIIMTDLGLKYIPAQYIDIE